MALTKKIAHAPRINFNVMMVVVSKIVGVVMVTHKPFHFLIKIILYCILKCFKGWMDCFDNSDESIELCSGIACGPHTFRCRNKR